MGQAIMSYRRRVPAGHHDRAMRQACDALRDAAQEQVRQSRAPLGSHDDEIDLPVAGDFDDPVSRDAHLRDCLNSHVGILDTVAGYPQLLIGLSLQFCHVDREAGLGGAGKVKVDHVQEGQASPKLSSKRDGVCQGMIGICAQIRGHQYMFVFHREGLSRVEVIRPGVSQAT